MRCQFSLRGLTASTLILSTSFGLNACGPDRKPVAPSTDTSTATPTSDPNNPAANGAVNGSANGSGAGNGASNNGGTSGGSTGTANNGGTGGTANNGGTGSANNGNGSGGDAPIFTLPVDPTNPPTGPSPIATTDDPNALQLNPDSMRDILLTNNTSLRAQANRVLTARDQVNIARANLLPSINLGVLLYASSPTFMVSAVSYLLPFLFPNSWFEVFKQKDLYNADKVAYRLLKLNTYASAYNLYHSILTDGLAREALAQDVADLQQIEQVIAIREHMGATVPGDLENIRGQRAASEASLHKMDALLYDEIAAMRFSIGYNDVNKPINVTADTVEASPLEGLPLESAVQQSLQVAPEALQLQYLIKAAKWDKWERIFGFLSVPTASSAAGANQPASFTNLRVSGGLSFGLAYFPEISLSQRNLTDLNIRSDEMHLEFGRLLETTTKQLDAAKERVDNTTEAENNLRRAYQAKLLGYQWGSNDLLDVLDARTRLRDASVDKTRAISEVNMLRITLHRALSTSHFQDVTDCNDLPDSAYRGFRWPWQPRVRPSDVHPGDCHDFSVNGRPN